MHVYRAAVVFNVDLCKCLNSFLCFSAMQFIPSSNCVIFFIFFKENASLSINQDLPCPTTESIHPFLLPSYLPSSLLLNSLVSHCHTNMPYSSKLKTCSSFTNTISDSPDRYNPFIDTNSSVSTNYKRTVRIEHSISGTMMAHHLSLCFLSPGKHRVLMQFPPSPPKGSYFDIHVRNVDIN